MLEYLKNTVELLKTTPEESRHLLANLIEDGRFIPLGRGKAEIRFILRPLGTEETLAFLGRKGSSWLRPDCVTARHCLQVEYGIQSGVSIADLYCADARGQPC